MANTRGGSPQLALEFLRDRSGTPLGAKDQVNEILRVCMRHNIRTSFYITFRPRARAATSAGGAEQFSPVRKRWVRSPPGRERRRRGTSILRLRSPTPSQLSR